MEFLLLKNNSINEYKNFDEFSQSKEYLLWVLTDQLFVDRSIIRFLDGSSWKSFNDFVIHKLNGERHRADGPAVEYVWGDTEWWLNGELHRVGGPAIEYSDGGKKWYLNGERHRIDGPAVEYADGDKEWHLHDRYLSEERFNEQIQKL